MPGICTSAIKQEVLWRCSELRKSSALGNETALKPIVPTRSVTPSRTDSSSSTIEITTLSGAPSFDIIVYIQRGATHIHSARRKISPYVRKTGGPGRGIGLDAGHEAASALV